MFVIESKAATLCQMNVSHSYPEGVWTAPAPRRPSGSDPLPSRRLVPTRIELRVAAAGPKWRLHLKYQPNETKPTCFSSHRETLNTRPDTETVDCKISRRGHVG